MTDQSSTAGTVGAYRRDSWPAGWKPEAGDWVVVEERGPRDQHEIWVTRVTVRSHDQEGDMAELDVDRPPAWSWVPGWWVHAFQVVRPATPDEVAQACMLDGWDA